MPFKIKTYPLVKLDASLYLIPLIVKDPELMNLFFTRSIFKMHDYVSKGFHGTDEFSAFAISLPNDMETLVGYIIDRINSKISIALPGASGDQLIEINKKELHDILMKELPLLDSAVPFLAEVMFPKGVKPNEVIFGTQQIAQFPNRTTYSGLKSIVYLAGIFQLYVLLLHVSTKDWQYSIYKTFPTYAIKRSLNLDLPSTQDLISGCSALLSDELIATKKYLGLFVDYTKGLHDSLSSLKTKLDSTSLAGDITSIMPGDLSRLMTQEQLILLENRLKEVSTRADQSYSSPVANVTHFSNLDTNQINDLLPIEDLHIVSWNFFLKKYFGQQMYRGSQAKKKKIISVGIPSGLHRFLKTKATQIAGSFRQNSIIKLKIYRMDYLRPLLIHKPLVYLFDMNTFPTKILGNLVTDPTNDPEDGISKIDNLNFYQLDENLVDFSLVPKEHEYFFYGGSYNLNPPDKASLLKNHVMSFLLEEYLQFMSDNSFDEQKYLNSRDSINNSLVNETFFTPLKVLKQRLLSPRKFDRAFHIIFDPDEFVIDTSKTAPDAINDFLNKKIIINKNNIYQRGGDADAKWNEISYDSYHAVLEPFNNNNN